MASANNIERLREQRGWKRPELAKRMNTSAQQVERLEKGQRHLRQDWIDRAAAAFGVPSTEIINPDFDGAAQPADAGAIEMVGIRNTDATFGLGAQYMDVETEVEVLQFPRAWVETITHTNAGLLSWARARGASMAPTIGDGDLVLIDHSQRRIEDRDLIWAFTIDETRGIKRLRRKGDRVQIMSDNASVPIDEEPLDFLNIIGRVVAVIQKQ